LRQKEQLAFFFAVDPRLLAEIKSRPVVISFPSALPLGILSMKI
jgi:hypothetical protein